jgi:hypothetical protein
MTNPHHTFSVVLWMLGTCFTYPVEVQPYCLFVSRILQGRILCVERNKQEGKEKIWEGWIYRIAPNVIGATISIFTLLPFQSLSVFPFLKLLPQVHVFHLISLSCPTYLYAEHQGVNISAKNDFLSKQPSINIIYRTSNLYLRIWLCRLLRQKIWRDGLCWVVTSLNLKATGYKGLLRERN